MNEPINVQLSLNDVNLVLEALGGMPYYRVHEVIHTIQNQAQQQVNKHANTIAKKAGAPAQAENGAYTE